MKIAEEGREMVALQLLRKQPSIYSSPPPPHWMKTTTTSFSLIHISVSSSKGPVDEDVVLTAPTDIHPIRTLPVRVLHRVHPEMYHIHVKAAGSGRKEFQRCFFISTSFKWSSYYFNIKQEGIICCVDYIKIYYYYFQPKEYLIR